MDEIETSEFLKAIAAWLGEELTDVMASRLRLRFDESGSGFVSWGIFREFSESGNAREMVRLYMSGKAVKYDQLNELKIHRSTFTPIDMGQSECLCNGTASAFCN